MSERDDVLRRWRLGEERLYPVATVRPDLYQAVIGWSGPSWTTSSRSRTWTLWS